MRNSRPEFPVAVVLGCGEDGGGGGELLATPGVTARKCGNGSQLVSTEMRQSQPFG